jgi:hypothetical protein
MPALRQCHSWRRTLRLAAGRKPPAPTTTLRATPVWRRGRDSHLELELADGETRAIRPRQQDRKGNHYNGASHETEPRWPRGLGVKLRVRAFATPMLRSSCLQRHLRSTARLHADRVQSVACFSTAAPLPEEWLKMAAKETKIDKDAVAKKLSWHTPDVLRPALRHGCLALRHACSGVAARVFWRCGTRIVVAR